MKREPIDHLRANDELPTTRLPRLPESESIDVVDDRSEEPCGAPSAAMVDVRPVLSVDSDSSFSIGFSESE